MLSSEHPPSWSGGATQLHALGRVEDAQSSGRALKHVMIAGGLLLMWLFGSSPWVLAFWPLYLAVDYSWVWHLRYARRRDEVSRGWYGGLIAHHGINVAAFGALPLTVATMQWPLAMTAAVTLIVAQAFHNLAYEVRSRDQFVMSYVVMATVAQILAAIITPQGMTVTEQVFLHLVFLAVSGFGAIAGLQANRMQRSLDQTTSLLAAAQRGDAVGQLTNGIAHDFNNLLTVLRGNIDLLDEVSPEERTRLMAEIRTATNRGAHLVSQLMSGARRGPQQLETVDMADALNSFATFARRALPANVSLIVKAPAGLMLRTERAQLEAALLNLIVNARDAMADGGEITISAQTKRQGPADGILLRVRDNGPGMTPDVLSRALEPYVTTKAAGQGTGLGLPMVRGYAETQGGEITLTSADGAGVVVSLWLPV